MDINLLSHPLLKELARTHGLQLTDIKVESRDSGASIRHSIEKVGDAFRLVVDHSHFTAKRTEFALEENDDNKTAAQIVQAVQDIVIGLQARTFEMLASVNGAVINSLDENEIVHNVLREVMHVLPHSDAGVFRLFDEASGFLVPVSHVGLPEDYSDYRVQPNESVSGEVFATGRPAIHNGRQNIIDAHRVMRPESQSFMERSEIANALLCVPVMAEGKRLGTLTTLCFSNDGAFSIFDRTVLEFLAAQIAVAFQRSLTYKNAVATAHRLEQMRSDLAHKNAELDRAVELHEALLRIFSTRNGLPEQLRAVAELFRVDFRFENVLGLDYRSVGWVDDEQFVIQTVEVAEAPVGQFYFPTSGDAGYHRALFGTLATFAALDFVRDMSRMDVLNARRKAHFDALIAGLGWDGRHSHQDGFRLERYSQVFVARTPQREASNNTRLSLHKSQSDLQKGMTLSNALIFHSEDQIVALVSASTTAALERNLRAISDAATKFSICIGASEIYGESERHLASRDLAAQAADALSRRGRSGLLRHRDMGVELLLEGRARRDIIEFTRNILTPLVQDPKHRVLHETLSRYVHEGKSVTRTAQALNIHPNTLYQRLQRVESLTGRKITDAADFTLLSLACQLYAEYSRAAAG
ncbi:MULTISPECIES: helix-turn-helix domain-containing protein [Rhizobium]|uniref:helix-turn-helix domain-containing protein n=1 Tax=Rhizobium TaxID=379 RepID=UPI001958AB86|nr:helix-turn-helix domain-containing protein [Rhizobium lusitanum]MBM7047217.1 helix-turn-helix domain-containing protein [Rhizobium lusitanum]